jgi:hypothetical protein
VTAEDPERFCGRYNEEATDLWEEISFVEGDGFVDMLARRALEQPEDSPFDSWREGDALIFAA